jgi:hypothetical protein
LKARNVLWPVVIMSALSLAGACGSDDGDGGGGNTPVGGSDGNGDEGGTSTGATNSGGGTKQTGGMSTSDAGEATGGSMADAGASAGGMTGVGGAGIDLCADLDLNCEDDDNPCTEDECNPATGTCGIPRSGTSCDDGVFCNGDDSCEAGACTEHDGDPCNGQTCNEAEAFCECTLDEHCAEDVPGEWSECDYATTCIETGKRTRLVTTFACTDGKCVQGAKSEDEACTRDTDTATCEDDLNRCNGAETCKAGTCKGETNPDWACKDNVNKACYGSGTMCRECNGTTPCGGDEVCCCNTCHAAGYVCDPKKLCISPITSASFISAAIPAQSE